jgi:hypothetical protein
MYNGNINFDQKPTSPDIQGWDAGGGGVKKKQISYEGENKKRETKKR